jgi:hypothetical protein
MGDLLPEEEEIMRIIQEEPGEDHDDDDEDFGALRGIPFALLIEALFAYVAYLIWTLNLWNVDDMMILP